MNDLARSHPAALRPQAPRSIVLSYLLWMACFLGISGLHRLYMGRYVSGLLWFVTMGFLGVGNVIDAFLLPRMVDDVNRGARVW